MSETTPTIEAPKSRLPLIAGIAVLVVVLAVVAFFLTRGGDDDTASGETVRIGVVGASDPYWDEFVDAAAEEGIDVELRDFTDYTQPNPALAAGELDLPGPITDDAQIVAAAGTPVTAIDGDARNIKITTRGDLPLAGAIVKILPKKRAAKFGAF